MDFEGGNAERPFVLGAHYNGEAKSGYTPTTKAIHTKSGTKILLNDAEGSVMIEDPSGNIYAMDGKGNIKVQAPKNITFVAGENISLRATASIDIDAGVDISETAGAMINKNAIGDYSLIAANIRERQEQNKLLISPRMQNLYLNKRMRCIQKESLVIIVEKVIICINYGRRNNY